MELKDIETYFKGLVDEQLKRIKKIEEDTFVTDFSKIDKKIIGILPGDGIGPIISRECVRVLETLLKDEIKANKAEIKIIEGLTIENRSNKLETVPTEVLEAMEECHVLLKGPTVTPNAADSYPNLPSANSALRRELDLFCQVRRVENKELNIDWTFFRENVEGEYPLGSRGIQLEEEGLAIDFKILSRANSLRVARAAFDFAKANHKTVVTVITKANVIKGTDGNLIKVCKEVANDYEGIELQERYVDVTAAKIRDPRFNENFQVMVLPNLYGDIISDVAVEYMGGIGAAGAANIGNRKALFEATHGTAPFLIDNGRGEYASPLSLLKASGLMLAHLGFIKESEALSNAIYKCGKEKKLIITSETKDASSKEYTDYIIENL